MAVLLFVKPVLGIAEVFVKPVLGFVEARCAGRGPVLGGNLSWAGACPERGRRAEASAAGACGEDFGRCEMSGIRLRQHRNNPAQLL